MNNDWKLHGARLFAISHDPARSELERQRALDELVALFLPLVKSVATFYANKFDCRSETEDLVQEGIVGLLKAFRRFRPTPYVQLQTYAYHIISGEIRHYLRAHHNPEKNGRVHHYESTAADEVSSAHALPTHDLTSQSDTSMWLEGLLATLPEREREILYLFYGCDLPKKEIAFLTGYSRTTVSFLIDKSLVQLRALAEASEG